MLPILYKYSSKGQAQQWEIKVYADCFYTIEGLVGGKLTTSDPTVCLGKNLGKANETTPSQQALAEAWARWQKKLDKGYNKELTHEKKFFEPMLAHEYSKYKDLLFTVPTYVQPKLDGVRAVTGYLTLTSRNGKPIVSCPHLFTEGPILDGELYASKLSGDFNKIISLTRKSKPTLEDLQESKDTIQYWIYDFPEHEGVFSQRYEALQIELAKPEYSDAFIVVPTYRIESQEQLVELHGRFIEEGYEGTIIRLDLEEYENKRSKQLLKYKDFMDAEFKIVDVTPGLGNRAKCAGRLVCELEDGRTFGCSMTGTLAFMKKVLDDRESVIGKMATVKYFQLTPDGVPRFPTLKHIHDYE